MQPPHPLEEVLDALPEPVIVTDADGVLTYANTAAAEHFGSDKHIGLPLTERLAQLRFFRPDGSVMSPAEHPVVQTLASRAPVRGFTLVIAREHSSPRRYVMTTIPLGEGDRVTGTVSVLRDVTQAVELERALADHAARLEAIVNLASDAVFVVAADGRLLFANAVGQQLLSLPADIGLEERSRLVNLRDIHGVPIRREHFPSSRALAGETVGAVECMITAADGSARRVVTSAHPLRTPTGQVYAALVTMNDITEQVQAREEAEAAREAAEEANRLKDQFIAALSHELRTPLQPILGWTEVLKRHGSLDSVTTRALEAIRRNIRQQVRLVDDLLDLSRIVHGKLALRFEMFDLREHVRAAAEPYEEAAALKRVRLVMTLPGETVMMWGDGARVQQIASNLISNAVKFTPAGGQVSVQLVAGTRETLLEVEDTGEGIALEDMAVIFEAFRQGAGSRRRGGLGIGLDLVKRLTELHGGTVEAFSEGAGYGARFQVRLPLARPKPPSPVEKAEPRRRLDQRKILVIEDNDDTREVMKYMLEAEGAFVETTARGQDGVRVAVSFLPEVVLCDIGLPDIDGLEVARRFRARPELEATKLVALTGYGQSEDIRQALEAGFDAHLTKPINLDQLLAFLAEP